MASNNYLVTIPKLQGRENYEKWSFAMENFLELEGLSKCIDGTETENELVAKAKAKIVLSRNPSSYLHVKEATTTEEVWNTLKNLYENKGFTGKIFLLRNLISLRCKQPGHFMSKCPQSNQNEGTDEQTKGAFNVVFLNTNFNNNDLYLDSGASVHLTCRQDWLLNQREPIVKDIMIANNIRITVKSSGEVDILTKVGK
ncbi:hypothetical protein JTB14_007479 [Gonioctena quinquepunctata]|nr:hypothetical protein JTB14_007479 [Gonioctena quinquepunctata]